jgi:hypothetical protein
MKRISFVCWHGDVDLEAMLIWHVSTYICTLFGCFGDVPQTKMGDPGIPMMWALNIHAYAHVIAYLQVG